MIRKRVIRKKTTAANQAVIAGSNPAPCTFKKCVRGEMERVMSRDGDYAEIMWSRVGIEKLIETLEGALASTEAPTFRFIASSSGEVRIIPIHEIKVKIT